MQTQNQRGIPGMWYQQDPNGLAAARRSAASEWKAKADRCREALRTLVDEIYPGLRSRRERLTEDMHASERLALRLLNQARAFENLGRQGRPAGELMIELHRMEMAGEFLLYEHDLEVERNVAALAVAYGSAS